MFYWGFLGCGRGGIILRVCVCVCVWLDLHQDPEKSEPSSWGQPDGVTSISYQLLWHRIPRAVGDSTSGMHAFRLFLWKCIKQKHMYVLLLLLTVLFNIPAGRTRKPCTERADLPLQQHRLLLPSIQSRSLAGKPLPLAPAQTCTHYVQLHLRLFIWFIACHSGLGWLSLHSRLITEGYLRSAHSRLCECGSGW